MKSVLVFGSFDGLHPGHQAFLRQARALGDRLIVVLAQDANIKELKQHTPMHGFADRKAALEQLPLIDEVIPGDNHLGGYACVQHARPDVIAFGYDQQELADDFKRFQQATGDETSTIVLKPYQQERYKSSLLRTKTDT